LPGVAKQAVGILNDRLGSDRAGDHQLQAADVGKGQGGRRLNPRAGWRLWKGTVTALQETPRCTPAA
jgi:hypothetical protein